MAMKTATDFRIMDLMLAVVDFCHASDDDRSVKRAAMYDARAKLEAAISEATGKREAA